MLNKLAITVSILFLVALPTNARGQGIEDENKRIKELISLNEKATKAFETFDFLFTTEAPKDTAQSMKIRWRRINGLERIDSIAKFENGPLQNTNRVVAIDHGKAKVSLFTTQNVADPKLNKLLPDSFTLGVGTKGYQAITSPYDPRLSRHVYVYEPLLLRFALTTGDDLRSLEELHEDSISTSLSDSEDRPTITFLHDEFHEAHKNDKTIVTLNSKQNHLCHKVEYVCLCENWYRVATVLEYGKHFGFTYPSKTKIEFGEIKDGKRVPFSIRHFEMKPYPGAKEDGSNITADFHFPENTLVKDINLPVQLGGRGMQERCDVLLIGKTGNIKRRITPEGFEDFLREFHEGTGNDK